MPNRAKPLPTRTNKKLLMKIKTGLLTAALVALLFASCTDGVLVHRYLPVGEDGWARTDTLSFPLPAISHEADYTIQLGMRYGNLFPYEGIWVVVETRLHHPTSLRRDTISLVVTDEDGHTLGQGVTLNQREVALTTLHLKKDQEGTLRLYHIMRREVIPHITDMGICIAERQKTTP